MWLELVGRALILRPKVVFALEQKRPPSTLLHVTSMVAYFRRAFCPATR